MIEPVLKPVPESLFRADRAAQALARLAPRAAIAREMQRVWRAEIFTATALAGSHLRAIEVDALIDTGRANGNHRLEDYVLVRAYAETARWVADARPYPAGDSRPLVTIDELRQLNRRASAGTQPSGGAWRLANLAPQGGIVAPAAWLVAREATTLLDRFGRGPQGRPVAEWLACFMGRFARLAPFVAANGRTGRLGVNLMLRRLDFPPLVFEQRDRARFPRALSGAAANDHTALAELLATAIVRTCNRISAAAATESDPLVPLRIAAGDEYVALAKAAQRGRLRTIVRGGRYFTTAQWIAEYRGNQLV